MLRGTTDIEFWGLGSGILGLMIGAFAQQPEYFCMIRHGSSQLTLITMQKLAETVYLMLSSHHRQGQDKTGLSCLCWWQGC